MIAPSLADDDSLLPYGLHMDHRADLMPLRKLLIRFYLHEHRMGNLVPRRRMICLRRYSAAKNLMLASVIVSSS